MSVVRSCKRMLHVCFYDVMYGLTDRRNWCVVGMLMVFLHLNIRDLSIISEQVGHRMTVWLFPFIMTTRIVRLVVILLYIFLICEAPCFTVQSPYAIVRCGRKDYFKGKILFFMVGSVGYFLMIALVVPLMFCQQMEFSMDWGKIYGTIGNGYVGSDLLYTIKINSKIVNGMLPLEAFFLSFTLSVMMGLLMELIICFLNMVSKSKTAGVLVCSFFAFFDFLLQTFDYLRDGKLVLFSWFSWSDIRYLDFHGNTPYPTFTESCAFYMILIIVLIFAIMRVQRKFDITMSV